ncbi:hypothetical protein RQP46_009024 [Phenoliferia psychrophenolica]
MASLLARPPMRFSLLRPLLSLSSPSLGLTVLRSSLPFSLSSSQSSTSIIPPLPQSLLDLLPPWLLAVPKSKTSHSKKSMRSSNKGLKEQQGIVACPSCGGAKRAHHLCHSCHVDFRQVIHREVKERAGTDVVRN